MPTDTGSLTVTVALVGDEALSDLGTTDSTPVFALEQAVNVTITNDGKYTWPLIYILGPCKNPRISNLTVGRSLAWYRLEMVDGDVLQVNCRNKTSLLNGAAVAGSQPDDAGYWPLVNGDNEIQTGAEQLITGNVSLTFAERR